jgi:hypothetical protein
MKPVNIRVQGYIPPQPPPSHIPSYIPPLSLCVRDIGGTGARLPKPAPLLAASRPLPRGNAEQNGGHRGPTMRTHT